MSEENLPMGGQQHYAVSQKQIDRLRRGGAEAQHFAHVRERHHEVIELPEAEASIEKALHELPTPPPLAPEPQTPPEKPWLQRFFSLFSPR